MKECVVNVAMGYLMYLNVIIASYGKEWEQELRLKENACSRGEDQVLRFRRRVVTAEQLEIVLLLLHFKNKPIPQEIQQNFRAFPGQIADLIRQKLEIVQALEINYEKPTDELENWLLPRADIC